MGEAVLADDNGARHFLGSVVSIAFRLFLTALDCTFGKTQCSLDSSPHFGTFLMNVSVVVRESEVIKN